MPDTIDVFTAELSNDGQGFDLTISAPDFTHFTITRRVAGATGATIVRGANVTALSGIGAAYVKDVEVPQNTEVSYALVVSRATPALSVGSGWIVATGQVDFGSSVMYDLSATNAPTPVRVADWESLEHDIPIEPVWIDGRADPIVLSSARRLPASTLTLLTLDNDEYEAVMSVVGTGITCFAPRWPQRAGIPGGVVYVSISRVSEARLSMKAEDPARYLALSVQEIAAPPADYVPVTARTWDEVIALGLTWDALAGLYTWDEVAYP